MSAEQTAGRPRDARIDSAVLAAAREVIAEVGYGGLTFTEVAARAGTSVPAIRRRWPSKSHLAHRVVFPIDVAIPPRDPSSTIDDELRSVIDGCGFLFADPAMRRALMGMFSEAADGDAVLRQLTDSMRDLVWVDLAERLALAAEREGVVVDPDPRMLVEVAFGATLMAVMIRDVSALDDAWRANMLRTLRSTLGV